MMDNRQSDCFPEHTTAKPRNGAWRGESAWPPKPRTMRHYGRSSGALGTRPCATRPLPLLGQARVSTSTGKPAALENSNGSVEETMNRQAHVGETNVPSNHRHCLLYREHKIGSTGAIAEERGREARSGTQAKHAETTTHNNNVSNIDDHSTDRVLAVEYHSRG